MWVRKRIDIAWTDLAYGAVSCCLPRNRRGLLDRIAHFWTPSDDVLVSLSVRSGFDLLLASLELPPKSEVLIAAANIADMARIVEHHGLVPVPVELDVERMAPNADALRRAVTPATKAILAAHLFGSRIDLEPIFQVARQHGLLFFEDCAQTFDGGRYQGHPDSDVVMFSFGSVKTSTALGGGILRVRNADVLQRMRDRQAEYPRQQRRAYFSRLLKYASMKLGSLPYIFGLSVWVYGLFGGDHDRLIGEAARGFRGGDFFTRIRQRPSTPLLDVLWRRLRKFNAKHFAKRIASGEYLAERLQRCLDCPAVGMGPHSYWAFPVVVDDPDRLQATLARAGFDCTQGHNLHACEAPADRPELDPVAARTALDGMVYLPCYPELPKSALKRMAEVLVNEFGRKDEPAGSNGASAAEQRPAEEHELPPAGR